MIASNLYRRLAELLPQAPLLVAQVSSHNADGTSTVQLVGGGTLRARGQAVTVGQMAFVRDGVVEGAAPNLTVVEIEV